LGGRRGSPTLLDFRNRTLSAGGVERADD